jgi:hypothetical protein
MKDGKIVEDRRIDAQTRSALTGRAKADATGPASTSSSIDAGVG